MQRTRGQEPGCRFEDQKSHDVERGLVREQGVCLDPIQLHSVHEKLGTVYGNVPFDGRYGKLEQVL